VKPSHRQGARLDAEGGRAAEHRSTGTVAEQQRDPAAQLSPSGGGGEGGEVGPLSGGENRERAIGAGHAAI